MMSEPGIGRLLMQGDAVLMERLKSQISR